LIPLPIPQIHLREQIDLREDKTMHFGKGSNKSRLQNALSQNSFWERGGTKCIDHERESLYPFQKCTAFLNNIFHPYPSFPKMRCIFGRVGLGTNVFAGRRRTGSHFGCIHFGHGFSLLIGGKETKIHSFWYESNY
jgi:hypothetical protein